MAYCTSGDVKVYTREHNNMDEFLLDLLIPAVTAGIDRFCRQTFTAATATEVYDYKEPAYLRLRKALVSLTSVTTNSGQTLAANKFVLEPRSGPPYYSLRFVSSSDVFLWTGSSYSAISVTGSWARSATVPADIKLAACMWVAEIYALADTAGLKSMKGGGIDAQLKELTAKPPDSVQGWLLPYRLPAVAAIG